MRKQWGLQALLGMATVAMVLTVSRSGDAKPPQSEQLQAKSKVKTTEQQDEGERKFQQNCSRCHNAPEGFSTRISGTVVRHMRVRASLSQKDAEAILHFLNP